MYFTSYTGEPEQRKVTVGNIDLTISMLVSTIMNVWLLMCRVQCLESQFTCHLHPPIPFVPSLANSFFTFHVSYLTQQAGMDSICREVDSLRELVHTAARAATETGVTMPSPDKAHRHTSIYRRLPSVTVLGMYLLVATFPVPTLRNTNIEVVQTWRIWYFCHVKTVKGRERG